MATSNWSTRDIPNLKEKVAIITGASAGLGKEATHILADKGATVVMAVRNVEKGEKVRNGMLTQSVSGTLIVKELDLSSLASVKSFADEVQASYTRIDLLINNAGVMACPFGTTEDGLEVQMGINHFGHFALTGHLTPLLQRTPGSRIVATSSIAHRTGKIDFDDINWEQRKYRTAQAYSDSKLANLYFAYELGRRLSMARGAPLVVAAHPGWTRTDLQRHSSFFQALNPIFSQPVSMGVLPTLRAAVDPTVKMGDYYGPAGWMEMKGYPVPVGSSQLSRSKTRAKRLWDLSEEVTGVRYPLVVA